MEFRYANVKIHDKTFQDCRQVSVENVGKDTMAVSFTLPGADRLTRFVVNPESVEITRTGSHLKLKLSEDRIEWAIEDISRYAQLDHIPFPSFLKEDNQDLDQRMKEWGDRAQERVKREQILQKALDSARGDQAALDSIIETYL